MFENRHRHPAEPEAQRPQPQCRADRRSPSSWRPRLGDRRSAQATGARWDEPHHGRRSGVRCAAAAVFAVARAESSGAAGGSWTRWGGGCTGGEVVEPGLGVVWRGSALTDAGPPRSRLRGRPRRLTSPPRVPGATVASSVPVDHASGVPAAAPRPSSRPAVPGGRPVGAGRPGDPGRGRAPLPSRRVAGARRMPGGSGRATTPGPGPNGVVGRTVVGARRRGAPGGTYCGSVCCAYS
jgi:hypothetical protein